MTLQGGKRQIKVAFTDDERDNIKIRLREAETGKFAEAKKRNIDHGIAILPGDLVILVPRVRSEISLGELDISGRLLKPEAGCIASLLKNGALPLIFYAVK